MLSSRAAWVAMPWASRSRGMGIEEQQLGGRYRQGHQARHKSAQAMCLSQQRDQDWPPAACIGRRLGVMPLVMCAQQVGRAPIPPPPPGSISTGVMASRRRLCRMRCSATSGAGGAAVPRAGSLRRCSRPATLAASGASLHGSMDHRTVDVCPRQAVAHGRLPC